MALPKVGSAKAVIEEIGRSSYPALNLIEFLRANTIVASSAFVYTNAIFAARVFGGSAKYLLGTSQTLTILHPRMQAISIELREGTALMNLLALLFSITMLRKTGTDSSGLFIHCS
ncbi:MAG: hypothetical protein ACI4JC_03565 [Faecalibacterium sp.]